MLNKSNVRAVLKSKGFALCLLYFLAYGSGAAWRPLFNIYLKDVGLSGIQIGVVAGVIPMIMLITQPFWGIGADRWGRQRCLMLAMFLSAMLTFGFFWGTGFGFFFCWMILAALFTNPIGPLIDSLALDYLDTKPNLSYGHMRLWGAVGWAVIATAIGLVFTGRDMSFIFPMAMVLMLSACLIGFRLKHSQGHHAAFEVNWKNLVPVLHNWRLITFLILAMVLSVATASMTTFYAVYLDDIGASCKLIGLAFGIQGFSELPFYLIAGAIIKRFGTNKTLLFTFLATTVRLFLYSITSRPGLAVSIEAMHGLTWSLFLVTSVEHVNKLVKPEWRATGQSLFWAAYFGAGAIMGNLWAGSLYDRMPLQKVFGLNSCLILVLFLVAMVVFRANKAKEKP